MWGWLSGLGDKLKTIWESISNIPNQIIEGLKGIFVPDTDEIRDTVTSFTDELRNNFGFDTSFFERLGVVNTSTADRVVGGGSFGNTASGVPVGDLTGDYNISGVGTLKLKFFDSSFFVSGVEFFRPYIRGFIVLLLCIFNVKMFLSFIRQDAGVVTGKAVHHSTKGE